MLRAPTVTVVVTYNVLNWWKYSTIAKYLTNKADSWIGTSKAEVVLGLGGDDSLDGKEGKDQLHGGNDNDTIRGGTEARQALGRCWQR
ncbi:MAG: hypothetical protein AB7I59_26945 [Geminicoccaceae bacterium]